MCIWEGRVRWVCLNFTSLGMGSVCLRHDHCFGAFFIWSGPSVSMGDRVDPHTGVSTFTDPAVEHNTAAVSVSALQAR